MVHGHLREARHPLAVGHYAGDGIVSAEAELDRSTRRDALAHDFTWNFIRAPPVPPRWCGLPARILRAP